MQTLAEQIGTKNEELQGMVPAEKLNQFSEYQKRMEKEGLSRNAVKVGDTIPLGAELTNVNGNKERIFDIIDSPTVITFYRGSWCPYCNVELKAYQDILTQIKEKGAKLIAVSPELPDSSLSFKEKMELEFGVYSDVNNELAKKLGLVFKLDDKINALQKEFGMDIAVSNGNTTGELPFAATFVVDKKGNITYAFVDENYTRRAEPSDVLKELDKLV